MVGRPFLVAVFFGTAGEAPAQEFRKRITRSRDTRFPLHSHPRVRFRVHKRNLVELNQEALWRSAMFAETITISHSKLSRPERLGPFTASNARFTCWRRPVPTVIAR